ncbi:MAG: hypothetical protein ACD_22C00267G0003, partial [uncultured bacterium]
MYVFVVIPIVLVILVGLAVFIYAKSRESKTLGQVSHSPFEIIEIQMPKNPEDVSTEAQMSSLSAENMFCSLHGLLKEDSSDQEHFSFEMCANGADGIKFYAAIPQPILKFVESQIYAQYPTCSIRVVPDYTQASLQDGDYEISYINLTKDQYLPIKTFRDFEIDPLSAITAALSSVFGEEKIWFQVLAKPVADGWQKPGYDYINAVRTGTTKAAPGAIESFAKVVFKEMIDIIIGIFTSFFTAPTESKAKDAGKA